MALYTLARLWNGVMAVVGVYLFARAFPDVEGFWTILGCVVPFAMVSILVSVRVSAKYLPPDEIERNVFVEDIGNWIGVASTWLVLSIGWEHPPIGYGTFAAGCAGLILAMLAGTFGLFLFDERRKKIAADVPGDY